MTLDGVLAIRVVIIIVSLAMFINYIIKKKLLQEKLEKERIAEVERLEMKRNLVLRIFAERETFKNMFPGITNSTEDYFKHHFYRVEYCTDEVLENKTLLDMKKIKVTGWKNPANLIQHWRVCDGTPVWIKSYMIEFPFTAKVKEASCQFDKRTLLTVETKTVDGDLIEIDIDLLKFNK